MMQSQRTMWRSTRVKIAAPPIHKPPHPLPRGVETRPDRASWTARFVRHGCGQLCDHRYRPAAIDGDATMTPVPN